MERSISIHPYEGGFRISNKGKFTLHGFLRPIALGLLLGFMTFYWESLSKIHALLIGLSFGLFFTCLECISQLVKMNSYKEVIIDQDESQIRIINRRLLSKDHSQTIENFQSHQLVFRKFSQRGFQKFSLEYNHPTHTLLLVIPRQKEVNQIKQLLERA